MNKKLRTWLAGVRLTYPAAFSPYWHMLPLGRMKTFLAGYFFIGAAGGFPFDLLLLNASRRGGLGAFSRYFLVACQPLVVCRSSTYR